MSAIARWLHREGKLVSGYDKTPTPLTDALSREGIKVHFKDEVDAIPAEVRENIDKVLVVYTPAIPKDNIEFNYLKWAGYTIKKRSEVLGLITAEQFTVAVAGTHGKTTTSSMIAHILHEAQMGSVGFLGGVLQNYESNLVITEGYQHQVKVVVEADEFDRSFLTLNPDIAVVTSADADHLDIYGSHDQLVQSFGDFIAKLKAGGKLFINEKISQSFLIPETVTRFTYSLDKGDFFADSVAAASGCFTFNYMSANYSIEGLQLKVPGYHNVENAIAAISVSLSLGIDVEVIKKAISSYRGVKRRFEYHIQENDLVYIDDYAHHPTEINALLDSVKALYPDKKITVIFQPHLFTRTRDFAEGFAQSLSKADQLVMMHIYPARELPIEGVSSEMILKNVDCEDKQLVEDDQLLDWVKKEEVEVLLTVGAGDIDRFILPIKQLLSERRDHAKA